MIAPVAQVAFAARLQELEQLHLTSALAETVQASDLSRVDKELSVMIPNQQLSSLAAIGIRGEAFFPCSALLQLNPRLLGYYRLLYGISQKQLYKKPFAQFESMEASGTIGRRVTEESIHELCRSLCKTGLMLLTSLPTVSLQLVRDLQLMTLGQQLKGSYLNEIGRTATRLVFLRIRAAISDTAVVEESRDRVSLLNASGRRVLIAFASDPDIVVTEQTPDSIINKLAIEIKGGEDRSNIHNRLGEAEKSHLKARSKGFNNFWTIINAPVNREDAIRDTPTTSHLFELKRILDPSDDEWITFRDLLASTLGVPTRVDS